MSSVIKNILYVYRQIWKKHKIFFLFYFLQQILQIALSLLALYIPKIIIDAIRDGHSIGEVLTRTAVILGIAALTEIVRLYCVSRQCKFSNEIGQDNTLALFVKFMEMDYADVENPKVNDENQYVKYNTQYVYDFVVNWMEMLIKNIISIFTYSAIVVFISPIVLLLIVVSSIVSYVTEKNQLDYVEKNKHKWSRVERKQNFLSYLSTNFAQVKDIKIYGMQSWIGKMQKDILKERFAWDKKISRRAYIIKIINLVFTALRELAAYLVLIYMLTSGKIGIGDFAFYFGVIASFTIGLKSIMDAFNMLGWSSGLVTHFREYLAFDGSFNYGAGAPLPTSEELPLEITFDHVSYSYEESSEPTIKDICLTIHKGEKIALVGENGAGKTTLVKLLCGMYYPSDGDIRINGVSQRDFNIKEYYTLFSVAFQDIHILPVRIVDYITSVDYEKGADTKKAEDVVSMVGLDKKIRSLPNGLNTRLGKGVYEDATDLSGGEMQKLVLARALYKDAPILILDEPTAALDPVAESEIYQQYERMTSGKTSVYISHRLASTRFCDRIIYLENGRIAETGSHDGLMKKGGKYAEMFGLQSKFYRENSTEEEKGEEE